MKSLKIIVIVFIVLVMSVGSVISQESLRIFDVRKRILTYSLKELNDTNMGLKKEPLDKAKKNEDEVEKFGPIYAVDFAKDNKYIFTGGTDGQVSIWNIQTGSKFKTIKCHEGRILGIKPYIGLKFFSVSDDGEIGLFNGNNGKAERFFNQEDNIEQAVSFHIFNQNGEIIENRKDVKGDNNTTVGMEKKRVYHTSLDVSADKKYLVVGSDDGVVRVFNIDGFQPVKYLRGHKKKINAVAFMSNKHDVISASDDGTIIIWDWESSKYKPKVLKGHVGPVLTLATSNNQKKIASGGVDNMIKIWDVTKDSCVGTLMGHDEKIMGLAFSKNGKYLASASIDQTIRIWNANMQSPIKVYSVFNYPASCLAISKNENFILTGAFVAGGGAIRLWQFNYHITEYEKQFAR